MSQVDHPQETLGDTLDEPSDAELISRVRGGDTAAYGTLFSRHVGAANRLARSLIPGPDADDLVSESFTKVLNVLLRGGGPDIAFRAYLLTSIRRLHVDKIRATNRATPTEDMTTVDPGVPFVDTAVTSFEGGAAARAFASLPERWQTVLWHLEVEGEKPAEIAPLLGMSANSVSALAYRAREGLRQAFLQMHTADLVDEDCRWTHDNLGAYVRGGLSRRDTEKVQQHLDSCRRCMAIYLELAEVNSSLAALLAPLVLGGAAAAYLAGGAAGSAVGAGGVLVLLGRARDVLLANAPASIAVGAAATVAGVAAVGIYTFDHQNHARLAIDETPHSVVTSVPPPTPAGSRTHHQTATTAHRATHGVTAQPGVRHVAPRRAGSALAAGTGTPSALGASGTSVSAPSTGPAGHPSGNPGPGPTPPSTPQPSPTPKPTPKPKPPPGPPPPPPPPPSADLRVSGSVQAGLLGAADHVTLTVGGLPAGATTVLTVTARQGFLLQDLLQQPGCSRGPGRTTVCHVSAGSPSVSWQFVHPLKSAQVSASVATTYAVGGATHTDADTGNNTWSSGRR